MSASVQPAGLPKEAVMLKMRAAELRTVGDIKMCHHPNLLQLFELTMLLAPLIGLVLASSHAFAPPSSRALRVAPRAAADELFEAEQEIASGSYGTVCFGASTMQSSSWARAGLDLAALAGSAAFVRSARAIAAAA